MTYRGHVENGVVVLDEPNALLEGAKVLINLPPSVSIEIHPDVLRFSGILPVGTYTRDGYRDEQAAKHQ